MTNEEKDLLIAYLVDAGEIDPDGDVEAQFLEWYQVRQGQVAGAAHYEAILEAARVRKRNYQRGYQAGCVPCWGPNTHWPKSRASATTISLAAATSMDTLWEWLMRTPSAPVLLVRHSPKLGTS